MKINTATGIFLLNLLLVWSCAKDIGNYEYSEINAVKISGIKTNDSYTLIAHVDTLTLTPSIASSVYEANQSPFKYEWKIIPETTKEDEDEEPDYVVSQQKDLVLPISLNAGKYYGYFVVQDTLLGINTTQKFQMRIRSITNEGWLVLSDNNGEGHLDVIFDVDKDNHTIAKDIWNGNDFSTGVPRSLIFNYSLNNMALLYTASNGTFMLDNTDLHVGEDNNIKWNFGSQPQHIQIEASAVNNYGGDWMTYWTVIDNKGDLYHQELIAGSLFAFPNNYVGGEKVKLAPYIGVSPSYKFYAASTILFDEANQRFLELKDKEPYPTVMSFKGQKLFDAEIGMDLVHMEVSGEGLLGAILKKGNDFYYAVIRLESINYEIGVNYQTYFGKINGNGIENATHFAFHPNMMMQNYGYFATGNKICRFEMSVNKSDAPSDDVNTTVARSLGENETITVLKFCPFVAWTSYKEWEKDRQYYLVTGTVDSSKEVDQCGKVYMFDMKDTEWPWGDKVVEIENFGKITDIVYKERKN